ncbi:MAG TPA: hypothetical protein VN133_10385 [Humibacter sp.]|nr:hypothetical protein [Humibacter sp.]
MPVGAEQRAGDVDRLGDLTASGGPISVGMGFVAAIVGGNRPGDAIGAPGDAIDAIGALAGPFHAGCRARRWGR